MKEEEERMQTKEKKYAINERTVKKVMEKNSGYITTKQAGYLGIRGIPKTDGG